LSTQRHRTSLLGPFGRPAIWAAALVITASACAQALDFDGYNYGSGGSGAGTNSGGDTSTGASGSTGGSGATGAASAGGTGGTTSTGTAGAGGTGLGDPCQDDFNCPSNNCEDGVCCDTKCEGTCRSCLGAETGGSNGTCGFISAGEDPDDECSGSDDCDGAGVCEGCDMTPTAPGGSCPGACTSCNGNVCNIQCTDSQPCTVVSCPSGFDCNVTCTGTNACRNAGINCSNYTCNVSCSGSEACKDATITCGSGACHLACVGSSGVCGDTDLNCGAELCTCTTDSGSPKLNCGSSCGCVPC
jgi:hypothetical protein